MLWLEKDVLVIIYGNNIKDGEYKFFDVLLDFLMIYLKGMVNGVYILLFFLFMLDDGFVVIDYCVVNGVFGDWEDIQCIVDEFNLMLDLVLNYVFS